MLSHQYISLCRCCGLAQDCSNSIANAMELLQSCAKPSIGIFPFVDVDFFLWINRALCAWLVVELPWRKYNCDAAGVVSANGVYIWECWNDCIQSQISETNWLISVWYQVDISDKQGCEINVQFWFYLIFLSLMQSFCRWHFKCIFIELRCVHFD